MYVSYGAHVQYEAFVRIWQRAKDVAAQIWQKQESKGSGMKRHCLVLPNDGIRTVLLRSRTSGQCSRVMMPDLAPFLRGQNDATAALLLAMVSLRSFVSRPSSP